MAAAERVRSLRELAGELTTATRNTVADDPSRQFELMKLLGKRQPGRQRHEVQAQGVHTLQVMHSFANADRTTTNAPSVGDMLESGRFDNFIIEELLHEALAGSTSDHKTAMIELKREVELVALVVEPHGVSPKEVIAKLSSAEARQYWSPTAKRLLTGRIDQYVQNLKNNRDEAIEYLKKGDAIVPISTADDIEHAGIMLLSEMTEQISINTALPNHQRLAARGVAAEHRKRRQGPKHIGETTVAAASKETDASEKPGRQLVFMMSSGRETTGSNGESDMFNDYAAAHQGHAGLDDELRATRHYLKHLDLSSGLPKGVRKLPTSYVKRGDRVLPKVYQLTAEEVQGLPAQSNLAVLFGISKDKVAVLAVAKRSEMPRIRTSLGLRGKRKS
jgi:hypothetical protein